LSKEIPSITVSPQQIGQVILNLIRNAVEAMTGHEEITSLNTNRITDNLIIIETLPANQALILNIRDNGPGIPSEDLQHIFDPFYARKKSMGMGIGLSICAGIIREHKGTIEAFSLNPGVLFQIKLPVN
jgi:signal transduction histidine kinase